MKNKKIIVVIAAICLLVISVGYALFSSNLNVSGTASASGEFDFTATCTPGFSSEVPDTLDNLASNFNESVSKTENGYSNDTCTVKGKDINMGVNFKYPNAMRSFTIKVTNTGSIPMKFDFENVKVEEPNSNYLILGVTAIYKGDSNVNILLTDNLELKLQPKENAYIVFISAWLNDDTTNNGKELSFKTKYTLPFKQLTD